MLSQQSTSSASSSPPSSAPATVAAPATAMSALGTVYATKRRRRNGKSLKPAPKEGQTKSNPSKRHRERLNGELDTIASLLPYEQNILSKLDRLSILRLSVSYLRTKSCFAAFIAAGNGGGSVEKGEGEPGPHPPLPTRHRDLVTYDHHVLDGELFLQALNGFLVILDCEGEVFFATHNIETYLGFHQSDIVHQSVYELVHSEDREELQRQLMWNSQLAPDQTNATLQDILHGDQQALERNFTVRFRCLLDNTSGFLRLDIRGRVKMLLGQNRKSEEGAPLALFAVCTPFGPPSLLELPQKEVMYKSKHKLDFSMVSMDQRGKLLLGYSDLELANKGGYDLVHYDDLAYVACAHQELLKTGASGMIAYRLQTRDLSWQWLQTSSRLVYKNSKPDFIICTHRPLMEEEGRDLLGKRTMDFKVSYLDPGLTQSYLCDSELPQLYASRMSRRYKTHLRDFLSTCRTKRNYSNIADPTYNNYNNVYTASTYTTDNTASLYMNPQNLTNLQTLYPTSYIPTDNLFHYRQLGSYYPDYMTTHSYVSNGYMDAATRPCLSYDTSGLAKSPTAEQKFYCSSQLDASKYATQYYTAANTVLPPLDHKYDLRTSSAELRREHTPLLAPPSPASTAPPPPPSAPLTPTTDGGVSKEGSYTNGTRQTVLMWGSADAPAPVHPPQEYDTSPAIIKKYNDSPTSISSHTAAPSGGPYTSSSVLAGVQEAIPGAACKWGPPAAAGTPGARSSNGGSPHEGASPPGSAGGVSGGKVGYYTTDTGEVWPPHQYYHHHHPYHTPHSSSPAAADVTASYYPPQLSRNPLLCCPSLR